MANLPLVIKANTMVDAIEKIFTNVWLKARHLALIITFFTYGKEKKTNNFGTYRYHLCNLHRHHMISTYTALIHAESKSSSHFLGV